ncbi:hypothetical protein ACJMK2_031151 [Sinanodonta woodiana]|uniref:Mitochondria-eating protein C-terminal domain-containing protein n=1 Tax=Sinanodonta woodiana TaxID=1069815 RepID=A0ABD3WZZ5_SINWO
MAVTDLDTPLHRLMRHVEAGDYSLLTKEFTDSVKQDFEERVRVVQRYSKEKRSFIFLKSFINKVRRKQFDLAEGHLRSASQEYEKFMLQYESLPGRKKVPAIKPYPQPKENEQRPTVIPNEALAERSSPPLIYSPIISQHTRSPPRPRSIPRSEIDESLQPPIETEPERPKSYERSPVGYAVTGAEEAGPKQIEKEREMLRYQLPVIKTDQEKLIMPEKRVREIKPKVSSYSESQDEVLPWLPAPEDKWDKQNRYGPTIQDSHMYSSVYDAYKRSLETSVLLRDRKLQLTDFYNPLRPSKLAEQFLDLYFNEYSHAFEELSTRGMTERNIVFYLLQIVTKAYEHCRTAIKLNLNQNRNIREEILRRSGLYGVNTTDYQVRLNSHIEQRRIKATQLLPYAREDFLQAKYPRILPRNIVTECLRVIAYAQKAMEVCWWMCVIEPPISMVWVPDKPQGQPSQPFNRDLYGPFTKAGSHLEYTVWPALLLYKHGPILSKGIAQGINLYM